MNKRQIICPAVAILAAVLVLGSIHSRGNRRALVSAVTRQLDAHSPQIAARLTAMRGSNVTTIEDATFQELQIKPSTSLISRSMIRVAQTPDGFSECVIDTSSLEIAPRSIRAQQPQASAQ